MSRIWRYRMKDRSLTGIGFGFGLGSRALKVPKFYRSGNIFEERLTLASASAVARPFKK